MISFSNSEKIVAEIRMLFLFNVRLLCFYFYEPKYSNFLSKRDPKWSLLNFSSKLQRINGVAIIYH